jgi:signal transduction histidine kinase
MQLTGTQIFMRGMNLQSRFMLIIGASSLLFALVIWGVFNGVTERLIDRLGARFAEKQVLYDKSRTLQPLIREVALARQMADSATIKQWAQDEHNPRLRKAALAKMESFRSHFQDGSYFLALAASGDYYFNDAEGKFTGKQLRYTLDRNNAADAWFFATLSSAQDYHINVDPDTKLGVTKVWINVLLRDGDKVLGVIGTGLDLTEFIHNVADINQPGITNLFVDQDGAIQIYRDVEYIDFSSIAKSVDKRRSIDELLTNEADRVWVRQAIAQVGMNDKTVPTRLVHIKGRHYLAGVAALPEVGWYDVTLLDLDILLPQRDFLEMALAVGTAAFGILLILAFALHRLVLRPVAQLTNAAARISQGNFSPTQMDTDNGEVGRLASQFNTMSDSIQKTQQWLEDEVAKRTHDLSDAKRMLEISLQQEKEGRVAQANLLALMAHEVRSPVAVISNTAQMLNALAGSEKPEWLPRLEKIMVAVRQLSHLMDEVLGENRIALTSSVLERENGDLNLFCEALHLRMMVRHKRAIMFEPSSDSVHIDADWQLIDVAISNLIENAVKYSPENSPISLRVIRDQQNKVCIEVHDQGQPIPAESRARIFEKFTRGQDAHDSEGVGLGLYLVNWIAQLHGGIAELTSAPEGNTFRITLG